MGELQSLADASGGALPNALLGAGTSVTPSPPLVQPARAPSSSRHREREPLPAPIPGRAAAFENFARSPSPVPPPPSQVSGHGHHHSASHRSGAGGQSRNHELRGLGFGPSAGGSRNLGSATSMRGVLGSGQFAPFSPDVRDSSSMQLGPPPGLQSGVSGASSGMGSLSMGGVNRSNGGFYEQPSFDDVFSTLGGNAGMGSFDSGRLHQFPNQPSLAPSSYQSQQIFDSISAVPRLPQHQQHQNQQHRQQHHYQQQGPQFSSSAFGNQLADQQQPISNHFGNPSPFGQPDNRYSGVSLYDSHDSGLGDANITGDFNQRNQSSSYGLGGDVPQGGVPYRRSYGRSAGDPSSMGR